MLICPGNLTRIPDEINLGGKNALCFSPATQECQGLTFVTSNSVTADLDPPVDLDPRSKSPSRYGPLGLNLLSAGSRPAPNL
jgi:hypothetical protein